MKPEEKCARAACDRPHDNWKHTDYTGRKYCASCAAKINRYHRDTHPEGLIQKIED